MSGELKEESWVDEWSKDFIVRRSLEEDFSIQRHSFYSHSPLRQFVQVVFTGFVKPSYYMKANEVYGVSRELHMMVAGKEPEFHLKTIQIGRDEGLLKDQPLIGLLARLKPTLNLRDYFDSHVELLSTYPPNIIFKKFLLPVKRREFGYGLGRHVKRLLQGVFSIWDDSRKLRYYVVRYRSVIKKTLKFVHYPINKDYARYLFGKELSSITDEYLRASVKFRELVKMKRYKDACNVAEEYNLPFELIRSSIPASYYDKSDVYSAILRTITPLGLLMFGVPLAKSGVPVDEICKSLERKIPKSNVTSFEVARPMFVSYKYEGGIGSLTNKFGELYASRIANVWDRINTSFLRLSDSNIGLILDASGSMRPERLFGEFTRSLIALAPLGKRVKRLVLFSERAIEVDSKLLCSLEGLLELKNVGVGISSGTNIVSGLDLMMEYVNSGEVDTVILSTDEQANINEFSYTEADIIKRMIRKGCRVVIHNPTPYPVHISNPIDGVTYIYGDRADSVIGSLRVQALRDLRDEEVKRLILEVSFAK
mgnify:CR=1 FL=1